MFGPVLLRTGEGGKSRKKINLKAWESHQAEGFVEPRFGRGQTGRPDIGTLSPLETLPKSLKLPPEKMIRALGRFMGLGRYWCSEPTKEEEPS